MLWTLKAAIGIIAGVVVVWEHQQDVASWLAKQAATFVAVTVETVGVATGPALGVIGQAAEGIHVEVHVAWDLIGRGVVSKSLSH